MAHSPFRAAIVGSRRRNTLKDRKQVYQLVELLSQEHEGLCLVSGGAKKGADAFCDEASRVYGADMDTKLPDIREASEYFEVVQAMHARNRKIAESCDAMFAWVSVDRKGGTENAIKHAKELGKPVYLIDGSGRCYLSEEGPECPKYLLG